eukprot:CAMPEP_0174851496 /NCGR_PEP_ID=MMETSP1114-20130205/23224_1 /TAXON_ID=312471 /ORGANISM="Neobodo designis, Strain CCAP 1951/1" /LENGTH=60 /DNA_ID=CAMNT_0016086035 /DNA_START=37 /DNA_END=219 /DNA_ORIENTATION=-
MPEQTEETAQREAESYADEHSVFEIFARAAQFLVENRPSSPLSALIGHLEEVDRVRNNSA